MTLRDLIPAAFFLLVCCVAQAAPLEIQLPPETAQLKPSSLPGRVIASQKCAICHSADYINLQPGTMSLKQWTAEVTKMQHAYGAPVNDEEIAQISLFLATTYGTEPASSQAVSASSATVAAVAPKAADAIVY